MQTAFRLSMGWNPHGILWLPRLVVPPDLRKTFQLTELPFDEASAVFGGFLAFFHRDPFDRMHVCQAIAHGVPILTPDEKIREYPIKVIW